MAARRVVADLAAIGYPGWCALMLRDPSHDPARIRTMADELGASCGKLAFDCDGIDLIINGAQVDRGRRVHLPFADAHLAAGLLAHGLIVGVSVHSIEETRVIDPGVEYLIASPVFPTSSKPGHPGIGVGGLAEICSSAGRPVFALGGITPHRAAECIAAGAHGIAAISLFESLDDVRSLLSVISGQENRPT